MKKFVLIFLAVVMLAIPTFSLSAADANGDGISDDIKELFDAYEAYLDKNIEIIKKYEDGDKTLSSTDVIKDWLELNTKALDFYNKAQTTNSDELTVGDITYITEVYLRVAKKLADYDVSSSTTATADTTNSTATSGAPQTFDAGIVVAASAMAISAGAVVSLKRRK